MSYAVALEALVLLVSPLGIGMSRAGTSGGGNCSATNSPVDCRVDTCCRLTAVTASSCSVTQRRKRLALTPCAIATVAVRNAGGCDAADLGDDLIARRPERAAGLLVATAPAVAEPGQLMVCAILPLGP